MRKYIVIFCLPFLFASCCDLEHRGGRTFGLHSDMVMSDDKLYLVGTDEVITVDVTDPRAPAELEKQELDFNIMSQVADSNFLYVTSEFGLNFFSRNDAGLLNLDEQKSKSDLYGICATDPVVIKDEFLYALLSTSFCTGNPVGLRIFDNKDAKAPVLIKEFPMLSPVDLVVDDQWLFVSEGAVGLKVFDVQDPENLNLIHHFEGINASKLSVNAGLLLVEGMDVVVQFDYSDMPNMKMVSQINLI